MKKVLLLTILIILIPVLIVGVNNKEEIIKKFKFGFYSNKTVKVKRNKTNEVITIPLEEYVIGVVAGEMPASFNIEALKAQAVASRTYVLKRQNSNNNYDVVDSFSNQVYIDYNQMKEKWKNKLDNDKYFSKNNF